jgi:dihydrofolate reductase
MTREADMGLVVLDMSMSLDGFIAGPNDDVERLHEWLFNGDTPLGGRSASVLPGREGFRMSPKSAEVIEEAFATSGAMVMGRRWFDLGERPWGDDPPFHVPVFVVTHRARERVIKGETTFSFVTDGIERAVEQAKSAAGAKNVSVGAANVAQQVLKAGLLDEVRIHLVPILLGGGTRLFDDIGELDLEQTRVIETPDVTHLRLRVAKHGGRSR